MPTTRMDTSLFIPEHVASILPKELTIRKLQSTDDQLGYLQLLGQLTTIGEITNQMFLERFNFLTSQAHTYIPIVIENTMHKKIIGSGMLLIEHKFIHECGLVGHIEDIVVHKDSRGLQLGKLVVQTLIHIAKQKKCYKIILNCSPENAPFYAKCGFEQKGVEFALYT